MIDNTAKTAQQPVAWIDDPHKPQPHCVTDLRHCCFADYKAGKHLLYMPLYAAPSPAQPLREPLTDAQINAVIAAQWWCTDPSLRATLSAYARAIEHLVLAAVNEAMAKEQK